MKTKLVDTVVGNGEYVRLRIYDGELTPDTAYQELLRLEQEQRKADRFFYEERIKRLINEIWTLRPNKGNKMNAIKAMAEIPAVDTKHILTLDADGNEIAVTIDPTQVAQDKEYTEALAGN